MLLAYSRLFLIALPYLKDGYYQNRYVPAPEMAEQYNMNVRALMPALKQLTRAGLLRSRVGGKEPGFIFSRDPQLITMLDVLNALQGESCFVCCTEFNSGVKCDFDKNCECNMYQLFSGIILQVKRRLSKVTLTDYCSENISRKGVSRTTAELNLLQQYG